jgi:hypothetical protein
MYIREIYLDMTTEGDRSIKEIDLTRQINHLIKPLIFELKRGDKSIIINHKGVHTYIYDVHKQLLVG